MSDKVYPLFKRKQKSKTDDDDCIVYLGAHVSKNSLTRSSESDTDSITKKNETKSDPSNTKPAANEINIKKENVSFGQNDSDTDLFTYYSQEQDSIFIDDESVFHNLETTDENTNKQNSLLNEEDSDEDEDIKLIFDSRDLIEQICRKYDKIEPKKEPQEEQSPILIKDKNHEIEVKTETFLVESDDDSDMDVLLCSIGEEYEKKSLNENNKKASDTDDDEFGIIEEESPILVKSPVTTTKQGINVFSNFKTKTENLFGSELDSLSEDDDDNNQTKKTDLNYKKNFSSKTPVRPPIMAKNVAKEHKEIQPVKRTILLNETPNKKQKISDGDEELFSHIERPPEKAPPPPPPPPPTSHDDDILNPIDAARKKLLQNIRKPVVLPMPIKKPGTSGITNKKTVELMIQNKFKKSNLSAKNQSISLTQSIYLARQENLIRMNQIKTTKPIDKAEMIPNEQTTHQEIKSKKIKINDQKENESVNRPSTSNGNIQVKNKSDLMGDIMNQMNVVHAKPKEIEKKPEEEVFIFENFLHRVSMCSFSWLHEQDKYLSEFKNVAQPPVVIPTDNVGPLIDNYLSYKDYYKTMFPLLLSEIWEDIFRDWRETKNELKLYQNSPIFLKSVDRVAKHAELISLTFQILIDSSLRTCPFEDDLLRLTLDFKKDKDNVVNQYQFFGIVRMSRKIKLEDSSTMKCIKELSQKQDEQTKQKHVSYTESSPSKSNSANLSNTTTDNKKLSVHEFVIYTRFRQFITSPGLKVDYQVITSLSSSFRRAKALIDFQSSPLLKTILNGSPLDSAFWFNKDPNEKDLKFNFLNEYNESQQKVILQCSSIINYQEPKLYFIQGPPGTGKSYTIIGIINAIFSRLNHYQNQAKQNGNMSESVRKKFANFKLLICSPSNGGCDELTRRIKTLRDKKNSSINELVMKRECNIVRVGRNDSIHRDCEEITLEYLFKKKLDQLIFEKKSEKSESLSSHFKSLQQTEKMLISRVKAFKMANKEKELKEAESSLEELKKKIKKFQDQFDKNKSNEISFADRKKLEIKAKEQVLKEADIIISTCNFSGNSLLDCLTAEKNNGHSQISVIIIDEAAQCLEVDTLIPLRFGCDKIIQVGDPEQLPATVLSKLAQEKGLTMSMFERIYQRFRFTDKNPIRMLYVQYRMHPEICEFPSANFYKGKLITHKEAAQKRSIIDLKPYLFLNVLNSQEIGDEISGSVYNPIEADQIVDFCKFLSGKYYKFSVGIITPYQKQVSYLKDLIAKNNLKIEVGTVDGYQGREKDIVIFSCVRARNSDKKIGFLSHRQRLNVALTRAKYALYIFGHVESLMVNEDWRNCIENAKKRNLIINLE